MGLILDAVKTIREVPPYSHKLSKLAEQSNLYGVMNEEQKDFLDVLQPLNIEARYPTVKQDIYHSLDKDKCKYILKVTEEMLKWIESKLKN